MGTLEELITVAKGVQDKMDTLIGLLANGAELPKTADAAEPAARRGRSRKEEPAKPTITDAQLRAEFERVKSLPGAEAPALKKIISDVGGVSTLALLCGLPDKFEAAMKALSDYEASLTAGAGEDDDDL